MTSARQPSRGRGPAAGSIHPPENQAASGARAMAVALPADNTLKACDGYPHGMAATNPDVINADMLAFIR